MMKIQWVLLFSLLLPGRSSALHLTDSDLGQVVLSERIYHLPNDTLQQCEATFEPFELNRISFCTLQLRSKIGYLPGRIALGQGRAFETATNKIRVRITTANSSRLDELSLSFTFEEDGRTSPSWEEARSVLEQIPAGSPLYSEYSLIPGSLVGQTDSVSDHVIGPMVENQLSLSVHAELALANCQESYEASSGSGNCRFLISGLHGYGIALVSALMSSKEVLFEGYRISTLPGVFRYGEDAALVLGDLRISSGSKKNLPFKTVEGTLKRFFLSKKADSQIDFFSEIPAGTSKPLLARLRKIEASSDDFSQCKYVPQDGLDQGCYLEFPQAAQESGYLVSSEVVRVQDDSLRGSLFASYPGRWSVHEMNFSANRGFRLNVTHPDWMQWSNEKRKTATFSLLSKILKEQLNFRCSIWN